MNIHYINECITFEINLRDKTNPTRSPNQSEDDFEDFCNNFELTLQLIPLLPLVRRMGLKVRT